MAWANATISSASQYAVNGSVGWPNGTSALSMVSLLAPRRDRARTITDFGDELVLDIFRRAVLGSRLGVSAMLAHTRERGPRDATVHRRDESRPRGRRLA